jgi:hypothetical protein
MKPLVAAVLGAAAWLSVGTAQAQTVTLIALLNGVNEVNAAGTPGQGDLDGTGTATITINMGTTPDPTVSWNITANNIVMPLSGSHIHQAPAGVNGGIVVDFSSTLVGSGVMDPDLRNVVANPAGFYVNLHNSAFPGGAIRGQLAPIPEPGTIALTSAGMLGVIAAARRKRKVAA